MTHTGESLHHQLNDHLLDAAALANLMTPALAVYPDIVDANITATLTLLGNNAGRWQPHVKTAKLESTMRQLCRRGVKRFKCATTLEMLSACAAGAEEVLMSYPAFGTRGQRVREIATMYPKVRISVTVETAGQVDEWRNSSIGLFLDINPGMNRTGIAQDEISEVVAVASHIRRCGVEFAGLHYYDGHNRQADLKVREAASRPGYEQLLRIADSLLKAGLPAKTLITSGTPALPCALSFAGFQDSGVEHRVSPGTLVYNDLSSISQIPREWGYQFAALVIGSVISHPSAQVITCDTGHKAVSSDAGFPNCIVLGHPELEPLSASEEHLSFRVGHGAPAPPLIGEVLYLVPKHICTTVNNFDWALLVRNGTVTEVVRVSARGRESPMLAAQAERM